MNITFLPTNPYQSKAQNPNFTAMRKTQFQGLDLFAVERFKAPIEKFNTHNDLYDWAKKMFDNIKSKSFLGRTPEGTAQRKAMLEEWFNYVTDGNSAYNPIHKLLILTGITAGLKATNDNLPPILNKGVLADTISTLEEVVKVSPKTKFNFNNVYETTLQNQYMNEFGMSNDYTGWVEIPSYEEEPDNFEENVARLKQLSHSAWCTRSFNAKPYLAQGKFAIYMENGQPKLGVRFIGDEIEEIQGERNNNSIPLKYFDKLKDYIYNEGPDKNLSLNAQDEMENAYNAEYEIYNFRKAMNYKTDINSVEDALKIVSYFETEPATIGEDGLIKATVIGEPSDTFFYEDIGINIDKILEYVSDIEMGLYLRNSFVKNLGKLKTCGEVVLSDSKIENLGELEECYEIELSHTPLTSLGNLRIIEGNADFTCSNVTDLGKLEKVGGEIYIEGSKLKVEDFANIEHQGIYDHYCGKRLDIPEEK